MNSDIKAAMDHLFAGRFQAAHAAAQSVLKEDPKAFEAVLVLAAIAAEHGNEPGTAKLCRLVREAGHESCWLAVLEARAALMRQDADTARERAEAASNMGSQDPHIANQLGVVLSRTGRHGQAVPPFRIAAEGAPANPDYHYNLAIALQFNGALAEARAEFERLVELQPDHAKGWLALAQLAESPQPGWAGHLADLFEATSDTETRLALGHALARLAELEQHWDASLAWLDRAKQAKARETAHDRAGVERMVDAAIASAQAARIGDNPAGDQRPIFVVGMPRSGTTLVERILSSHPRVISLGELSDFAVELKRGLRTPGPMVLDDAMLAAAAAAPDLAPTGAAYLARIAMLAGDAPHTLDKMPFNAFFVPAILRALSGARVVFLRRSPFDVLFANYRQLFATGFGYYGYAYDFGDTAHFVAAFERMAGAFEHTLPAGRFMPVRYEEVVADQRGQTERLLRFCGLEWDDACMEFHRNAQPVATASSVQVRSPIYTSSLGKWRRYGEGSQRAIAELGRYGIAP